MDFDDVRGPTGFFGELNFVHKRIGGAIKGAAGALLSGGNPLVGAAGGFINQGRGGGPSPQVQAAALPNKWPYTATADQLRGSVNAGSAGAGAAAAELARRGLSITPTSFAGPVRPSTIPNPGGFVAPPASGGGCPGLTSVRVGDRCVELTALPPGGRPAMTAAQGTPTLGFYGVGIVPVPTQQTKLRCPEGYVLGKDNVCYDSLPKTKRKWNPGSRPLLTGGEMNAISKAARAAARLNSTQKRLKKVERALARVT